MPGFALLPGRNFPRTAAITDEPESEISRTEAPQKGPPAKISGENEMSGTKAQPGSTTTRSALRRAATYAIASSAAAGIFLSVAAATAPAAQAATSSTAKTTARIQALLDSPVNGTVNLPRGTFTISAPLRLHQGERIVGHHTTLRVASGLGDYAAVLAGVSAVTDLSGLSITGVTFDQNSAGNPIRHPGKLINGMPRFMLLLSSGNGIKITGNKFVGSDNLNTIVTGGGTRNVTISRNTFQTRNPKLHDHSTIYTSGTSTVISNNTLAGRAAYHSAAIEVHGDGVTVTGNHIRGYYRGVNVVASNATLHRNHVAAAASPVDLWSVAPTALHNVTITGNVLNRDLPYWRHVLARYGAHLPAAKYLRPVTRDETSTLPFRNIVIHDNHG
jgi:hypothetical protein